VWLCWPSSRRLRPHPVFYPLLPVRSKYVRHVVPRTSMHALFLRKVGCAGCCSSPLIYPRPTTRPWTIHVTGTREVSGIFYEVWHGTRSRGLSDTNRYHENKSCEQLPNIPLLVKRFFFFFFFFFFWFFVCFFFCFFFFFFFFCDDIYGSPLKYFLDGR